MPDLNKQQEDLLPYIERYRELVKEVGDSITVYQARYSDELYVITPKEHDFLTFQFYPSLQTLDKFLPFELARDIRQTIYNARPVLSSLFGEEDYEKYKDGALALQDVQKLVDAYTAAGKVLEPAKPAASGGEAGETNAAKVNLSPQTKEQKLATWIINALEEWASVGTDNWEEKLPKEYRPNHCLEYRFSIHNKLGINPILEKLELEGKDAFTRRIEQLRDTLDKAVNACNENLDPTSPMHLPNFELSVHARNLAKALKGGLPYLGSQPASSGKAEKVNKKILFRWYLEGFALCILFPICIKRLTGMSFKYMLGIFLLELVAGLFVYFCPQIAKVNVKNIFR